MDINFQIEEPFMAEIDVGRIDQAIKTTLQLYPNRARPALNLAVMITDNETITRLNRDYRGINAPTDVLSFENLPDPDFPELDSAMAHHLGDIIIAFPIALTQAEAAGHTVLEELILLAVHGCLHLLEFDHDTPSRKAAMWAAQSRVMLALNLAHVHPTEG